MRIMLLLLAICLYPATAFAQPDPRDLCAGATDPDAIEIRNRLRWFALNASVEAEPVAKALEIIVEDRPNRFGPRIIGSTAKPRIAVPRGFFNLQCRMIIATWAINEQADRTLKAKTAAAYRRCRHSGDAQAICLQSTMATIWPDVMAHFAKKPDSGETAAAMAETALDAILFHEFAHAALGHLDAGNGASIPDQEQAANLYASTYLSITGSSSLAHAYNFQLLAELDNQGSTTHTTPSCTYDDASYIGNTLSFATLAIASYPNTRGIAKNFMEVRRALLSDFVAGNRGVAFESDTPPCNAGLTHATRAYRADLLTIARFQDAHVDRLPAPDDDAAVNAMLRELLALPVSTIEGEAIRSFVFSKYVRDVYLRTDDPSALPPIIIDFISNKKSTVLVAKDFGRLVGTIGIIFFHNLPRQAQAGEDNKIIHQLLGSATRYNPEYSEAWGVRGLLYLREGDCVNALPNMRTALATSAETDSGGTDTAAIVRVLEDEVSRGVCRFQR